MNAVVATVGSRVPPRASAPRSRPLHPACLRKDRHAAHLPAEIGDMKLFEVSVCITEWRWAVSTVVEMLVLPCP